MKKQKGMTLIETIVYLGLFALIFASIMQFSLSIAESNKKAEYKNNLQQNVIFLDELLAQAFNQTDNIDLNSSSFGADNGILALTDNTVNLIIYLENQTLKINRNGTINSLTNGDIKVNKFYLEQVYSPSEALIGARFTISIEALKDSNINSTFHNYYSFK